MLIIRTDMQFDDSLWICNFRELRTMAFSDDDDLIAQLWEEDESSDDDDLITNACQHGL